MSFPRRLLRPPRAVATTALLLGMLSLAAAWLGDAALSQQVAGANVDAAIATQRSKVAANPGSAEAYNDLGNLLALANDRAGAEEAYREALRLDPNGFPAHFNLAVLLRTGHRPEDAIEVLDRAIELEPGSAWAHYQRGAAHQALGHRKHATNDYARAFALDYRLALPDVNPLVIGNPLVTAAMLTRQDVPVADTTPRSYADPVAISQLLLPTPPPAPPAAAAQPDGQSAQAPAASSAPAVGEVRPPAAAGTGSTVPPGGAPTDPASGQPIPSSGDRRITNDDLRTLRILNQAEPSGAEPPEGGTRDDTGIEAPQRFRPGRRSSAQLELRLIPGGLAPSPERTIPAF